MAGAEWSRAKRVGDEVWECRPCYRKSQPYGCEICSALFLEILNNLIFEPVLCKWSLMRWWNMLLSRGQQMCPLFLATLFAQGMPDAPAAQSPGEPAGRESPVRLQAWAAWAACALGARAPRGTRTCFSCRKKARVFHQKHQQPSKPIISLLTPITSLE